MAGLCKHSPSDRASTFDPARNIRLVPPFQEKEVDKYFVDKTQVEFAREKENLFNRWCHSKEIGQDFKKLKQMVLLEKFKDTTKHPK